MSPLKPFSVHPHDLQGTWESNFRRYRAYAHELLSELEQLTELVENKWPSLSEGSPITDKSSNPDLWKLARSRDRISDSVRIYTAMAAEGFINFYGVVRLGQVVFNDHYERLGLVPKLRKLLLIADDLNVSEKDEICSYLRDVAASRNKLVHAKTREVLVDTANFERSSTKIPEEARKCVEDMEAFFKAFVVAVPEAKAHLGG